MKKEKKAAMNSMIHVWLKILLNAIFFDCVYFCWARFHFCFFAVRKYVFLCASYAKTRTHNSDKKTQTENRFIKSWTKKIAFFGRGEIKKREFAFKVVLFKQGVIETRDDVSSQENGTKKWQKVVDRKYLQIKMGFKFSESMSF